MSKKTRRHRGFSANRSCCIGSFVALLRGAAVYLLFRQNTYIHTVLRRLGVSPQPIETDNPLSFIAANWLGDFFWGLALGLMLFAVLGAFCRHALFAFAGAITIGASLEMLQKAGICSGTFDLWDIVAEGCGALLAVLFGLWIRKKEEFL